MKSTKLIKLILGTLLAIIATASQSQNWDPKMSNLTPFHRLEVSLDDSQSFLYLDAKCQVVAFIVPSDPDVYMPSFNRVSKRWTERTKKFGAAGTCPSSGITFLDTIFISGANANACKPNVFVNDADLVGVICGIKQSAIATLEVLNQSNEPLLILEGKLAQEAAPDSVPATFLGRTNFQVGNPCSPTVPSPCLAPKQGVMKSINGKLVCVCQ